MAFHSSLLDITLSHTRPIKNNTGMCVLKIRMPRLTEWRLFLVEIWLTKSHWPKKNLVSLLAEREREEQSLALVALKRSGSSPPNLYNRWRLGGTRGGSSPHILARQIGQEVLRRVYYQLSFNIKKPTWQLLCV